MDQYCILGRIGEGAHGIVFKAKHVEVRTGAPLLGSPRGARPVFGQVVGAAPAPPAPPAPA